MADEKEQNPLVNAARTVGAALGKVASAVGVGGGTAAPEAKPNLWAAEYMGSGTFLIHKPKRASRKRHQQIVKNRRRGMRK